MWLKKSAIIINAMLKIFDVMSLIYIYIYKKFGFRRGANNPNTFFPLCKGTKID